MDAPDYDFYADDFHGDSIAQTDWAKYSARALSALDLATRGKLSALSDSSPIAHVASMAICHQAEYYRSNGFSVGQESAAGESFTVGKVSVSESSGSGMFWERRASLVSPFAMALLESVGLVSRRVRVC